MKRLLTKNEIKEILEYSIIPNKNIPKYISDSIKNNIIIDFKKQLKSVKIYPEKIEELKIKLRKIYCTSIIQPGKSVGVLTAQSVGERQTQLTSKLISFSRSCYCNCCNGCAKIFRIIECHKKSQINLL